MSFDFSQVLLHVHCDIDGTANEFSNPNEVILGTSHMKILTTICLFIGPYKYL